MLPYTERQWRAFFTLADREELLDAYDITSRASRNRNIKVIYGELSKIIVTKTTAEWLVICAEIDVPCARIYPLDALPAHPHLQAVALFEETDHPAEGRIRQIRPAARFGSTPVRVRRHAPVLGEHTAEVLREAGLTPEQIDACVQGLNVDSDGRASHDKPAFLK